MTSYDLKVEVRDIAIRPFRLPAPRACDVFEPARFALPESAVSGFLVGVTNGREWGWWGPVAEDVAQHARDLFQRSKCRTAGTPGEWTSRLRRGTRHAHTGLLAVAVGVIELACWDLLGQLYRQPVWRLLTEVPVQPRFGSYATCFGIRLDNPRAARVCEAVAAVWPIQKWRPVRRLLERRHPSVRAAIAAGPRRLALDFGGMWAPEAALRFCARLPFAVAFIEEPCAPGELAGLPVRYRPAPIAAGEHCYGPDETAILDAANVEIWQPDAVFCGGFSALRAIAERAASRSRLLLPHGGGLLPALHAAAAGSVVDLIEYHLLLEPRRQVHWARSVLADANGMFEVPDEPGWAGPLRHDV